MDKNAAFLELVNEHHIEFVNFRYTDTLGQWLHITYTLDSAKDILQQGILTDGSSVKGWKDVNESDLLLIPDLGAAFVDPFTDHPTIVVICDVVDPKSNESYLRDPRSVAKKALEHLSKTNLGEAYFGPELEFFIFDHIEYDTSIKQSYVFIDSESAEPGGEYDSTGHRPGRNGGYWLSGPGDVFNDIRSEMLTILKEVGLTPIMQHHEVASTQCELGFKYSNLLNTADNIQKYKFVIKNVAHSYGKTATFMPKPLKDENGSGMHVH